MVRVVHTPPGRNPEFIMLVRRLFESGLDTAAIAKSTRENEATVERALHRYKDIQNDKAET